MNKQSKRGFATLAKRDPKYMKEIATKGGEMNTNRHQFTPEEARAAAIKGVEARRLKKKAMIGNE